MGSSEKFVEFYGAGLARLPLPDRATMANMAPEYGATVGFFPIDAETLRYLRVTGRSAEQVDLVERYAKAQGLFHTNDSPDPLYSQTLSLDMSTVEPSLAGPKPAAGPGGASQREGVVPVDGGAAHIGGGGVDRR